MGLLEGLFKKLGSVIPPMSLSESQWQQLSELNPEKFYVENVRSILGTPYWVAKELCETGVRREIFSRGVEVVCPNGYVAASAEVEAHLPENVECPQEEDGHYEMIEMPTSELRKVVFYRFTNNGEIRSYGPTA
jgi:hypothetical protein